MVIVMAKAKSIQMIHNSWVKRALQVITLPETNIAPEIGPSRSKLVFQPSIFRYVGFREGRSPIPRHHLGESMT